MRESKSRLHELAADGIVRAAMMVQSGMTAVRDTHPSQ